MPSDSLAAVCRLDPTSASYPFSYCISRPERIRGFFKNPIAKGDSILKMPSAPAGSLISEAYLLPGARGFTFCILA
jgi:hypothetical protein